jgi:hypothetical protein
VKFLDYSWIGNLSEDFRVCFTWNGTGIKNWSEFLAKDRVVFGNTGVGTSAYIDDRMLSDLFGAKLHAVMGYPGSADKRVAIERGELDGDCGSWTSLPEDWLRDGKITLLREALNAAALARAIYSQGIPELPGNGQAQGQPMKSSTPG